MKQRWGLAIGTLLVTFGLFASSASALGGAPALGTLSEEAAVEKIDWVVVSYHRHLTDKSPGGATCDLVSEDRFECEGRWKATATKHGTGVRTRFVYKAAGTVVNDPAGLRVRAQLTRWEIAGGVKKGPIKGALLKGTWKR